MLIIDEAHEGTQSNLGDTTFTNIPANFTLQLSGTPFNIMHKHEEEDIYTWDYVMEQEAKLHWDERNPGVPNPYAELPALSIFTYNIDTLATHLGSLAACRTLEKLAQNSLKPVFSAFNISRNMLIYNQLNGNCILWHLD
jgi:hypothetical protein